MNDQHEPKSAPSTPDVVVKREPYVAPRIEAAASLEQVTLFSGTVADGGIIFGDQ